MNRAKEDRSCVLVTGGAGYVGSHVVRKLLARGHRVRVLDSYLYGAHGLHDLFGHPRLEVMEGDVRDRVTLHSAALGVDGVIALAALVGDAACDLSPDETVSVNLTATELLIEACRRSGVRRLVFASTCSVYGANSSDHLLSEDSWLNPVSLYARTRLYSEKLLLDQESSFSTVILRLATVFGVSSRMRFDLLVNRFTAQALLRTGIRVFGGDQWRPNLHVQDAADAFLLALEAEEQRVRDRIFNVGTATQNLTVLDIAQLVQQEIPGTEVSVAEAADRERNYRVAFDRIRRELGFEPRFSVRDGIREIVNVFRHPAVRPMVTAERCDNLRYLEAHGFRGASRTRAAGIENSRGGVRLSTTRG